MSGLGRGDSIAVIEILCQVARFDVGHQVSIYEGSTMGEVAARTVPRVQCAPTGQLLLGLICPNLLLLYTLSAIMMTA